MNTKPLLWLFVLALVVTSIGAQPALPSSRGWNVAISVIDENSQPVPEATVEIWYQVIPPANQTERWKKVVGRTDTNGMFAASHADTHTTSLTLAANKPGYYSVSRGYELGYHFERDVWNPTITLVLKTVRSPIGMYAARLWGNPPATNRPVAFDLSIGDWIAPYGKGRSSDIIFTRNVNMRSKRDYDQKLIIGFPNSGDGIREFKVPDDQRYCGLLSPYEAPSGGYIPEIVRESSEHPGQPMTLDFDNKRNYFIRVRTVLDEQGNVKSALYGKIYGDFMHFTYYLNPTPNDRNVEFDPNHNLFPGKNTFAP